MTQEPDVEQKKNKLPILKILFGVIGGVALLALGAATAILYVKLTKPSDENPLAVLIERNSENERERAGSNKTDSPKAIETAQTGKPVPSREQYVTSYFEFPGNFTTNMRGSRRFVQMSIGLATQYDKRVIENVQKHEVAIRSEVLAVLAEQGEGEIAGVENRRRIQSQIRDAINRVLLERTEFGGIENVYITALVMQ